MCRKLKCLFIGLCFYSVNLLGQDVHFSQYNNAPYFLNPATTGSFDGKMRVGLIYRNQWSTVGSPYQTYGASYEMALMKKKQSRKYLGIGLNFYQDNAGLAALKRTAFNLSVAYNAELNDDNSLAVGIQGGYAQRAFDESKLTWDEQYDGSRFVSSRSSGEVFKSSVGYVDFAAGALWKYTVSKTADVNLGVGAFHLSQPKESLLEQGSEKLAMKYVLHGQGRFTKRNSDIAYYPNLLFALQGPNMEINVGMLFRYMLKESSKYTGFIKGNAVYFGANYRFADAAVLIVALELADWKVGLSYDLNISAFTEATAGVGGFEISLIYVKED